MTQPAIEVKGLHAWYGESHVLQGIDLHVRPAEVVTLLGRNGSGRTTTLRAMMGLTDRRSGSIRIGGVEAIDMPTRKIAHLGVGYCPEERGIFSSLSARENLLLPPVVSRTGRGMPLEQIYAIFPNLKGRDATQGTRLSGGEQQMLAIARILRAGANLLLLDEISEGLAPVIVQALSKMIQVLRDQGMTIVMVEQNFHFAAPISDRFYVMEHGQVVDSFATHELKAKAPAINALLGI